MTQLQRYLAEEIAEDMSDGIISRREAVHRLGLLGLAVPAAAGFLASLDGRAEAAATAVTERPHPSGRDSRTTWLPIGTEPITFDGPRSPLFAAWAPTPEPRGGVLVIHENRGLNDHIRGVAGRLAASGYSALALDLLSEQGGTDAFPGEAEVSAALGQIPPEHFVADMKAAVTELRNRVSNKNLGAIGFCFGGSMVWHLLAAAEHRLRAAAPFYGPFPEGGDLRGTRASVLGVFGGQDARVNATLPEAEAALEAARLKYELLIFEEAGHAFFNDTGERYDPRASAEAWRRTINWFDDGPRRSQNH